MWDLVLFLPCQSRKQKTYHWRIAINIREIISNGKFVNTMDPCGLTMTLQIEMSVCRIAEMFASMLFQDVCIWTREAWTP